MSFYLKKLYFFNFNFCILYTFIYNSKLTKKYRSAKFLRLQNPEVRSFLDPKTRSAKSRFLQIFAEVFAEAEVNFEFSEPQI